MKHRSMHHQVHQVSNGQYVDVHFDLPNIQYFTSLNVNDLASIEFEHRMNNDTTKEKEKEMGEKTLLNAEKCLTPIDIHTCDGHYVNFIRI